MFMKGTGEDLIAPEPGARSSGLQSQSPPRTISNSISCFPSPWILDRIDQAKAKLLQGMTMRPGTENSNFRNGVMPSTPIALARFVRLAFGHTPIEPLLHYRD